MKWLKRIVLATSVFYATLTAVIFLLQRNFLYFPPQFYLSPEAVELPGFDEIALSNEDGTKLTAFWSPPASKTDKVVLFFHGNGSAVYSNHDIYRDLAAKGIGVLGVGYPGYPGSEGRVSQAAIMDAAKTYGEFVLGQGISPDRLVYFGTSLGSGIAAQLAEQYPPSLLILEAPFNSILDMARRQMPFLPVRLLMKDQFRSDEALMGLKVPMIWMHGTADNVVPLSQGQKLFDGYSGPKTALIIKDGQHSNLWFLGGREIVLSALDASK